MNNDSQEARWQSRRLWNYDDRAAMREASNDDYKSWPAWLLAKLPDVLLIVALIAAVLSLSIGLGALQ